MGVPAFTAEHTKGVCQITFEISDEAAAEVSKGIEKPATANGIDRGY